MLDMFIELVEMDSRTKKRPEGRTRKYRADRIDTVSDTYERGGCTISVAGYHYHVETDSEEVLRKVRAKTDMVK